MEFQKICDRLFKPRPFIEEPNNNYKKLDNSNEHVNVYKGLLEFQKITFQNNATP